MFVGGALLFGIWWITQRREEVARAEREAKVQGVRRAIQEAMRRGDFTVGDFALFVFFLPWAVVLRKFAANSLGIFAFIEMTIFIIILMVGYVYA